MTQPTTTAPETELLAACPFCGAGETFVKDNGKIWTGMKYSEPVSVSVQHWCEKVEGQPQSVVTITGRDWESAIDLWNRRTPPASKPLSDEDALALAHRMAWRYKHSSDPNHSETYTFNRTCLLDLARAIEARSTSPDVAELVAALEDIAGTNASMHGTTGMMLTRATFIASVALAKYKGEK